MQTELCSYNDEFHRACVSEHGGPSSNERARINYVLFKRYRPITESLSIFERSAKERILDSQRRKVQQTTAELRIWILAVARAFQKYMLFQC